MARLLLIYHGTAIPARYGTAKAVLEDTRALAERHQVLLVQRRSEHTPAKHSEPFDLVSTFGIPYFHGRFATIFILAYLPKIYALCRKHRIQGVIVETVFLGWVGLPLRQLLGIPFAVRTHNIEGAKFRNLGKSGWRLLSRYERTTFAAANHVFFITERDRQTALDEYGIAPAQTSVLPYSFDSESMRAIRLDAAQRKTVRKRLGLNDTERLLLFYGMLDYAPNVQALDLIEREVVPRLLRHDQLKAKVVLCGIGLDETRKARFAQPDSRIIYAGFVDNINEIIASADCVLNPILTGGGVKTKLIEAIALARPVVSTWTGALGVDHKHCGDGLTVVADHDWDAFVDALPHALTSDSEPPDAFYNTYSRSTAAQRFQQGLGL
jgi:polysaccharide biosynthesis protein PslH